MRTIFLSTMIIVILSFISLAQNWFPLEVGNKCHFTLYGKYRVSYYSWLYEYSFNTFEVVDTVFTNNKKYFSVNGFFEFPNGTRVRYTNDSMKVILCKNNVEYTYMDFTLPDDSTFLQIQPDNSFLPITIVSDYKIIFGDTVNLKGFMRVSSPQNGSILGRYYFSPNMGFVYQIENTEWLLHEAKTITMIEYLFYDSVGNTHHKKHSNSANIQFNPIFSLDFGAKLQQEFQITHPLSVRSLSNVLQGRTYLSDVFLDYYYSNGVDSSDNEQYQISSTSEIDFSLNYSVDTLKYINGYSLYYRIVAKDKGIVPSYYYRPINGYYKLDYNPSPAQVLFSDDSIYVPTLLDSGFTKIRNTSDYPVRIDSIISVGSFYGYHGNFSKPGFEYPFYFVQTAPGFAGDTLGIIIPPHDSINISFSNIDLCPICDYEVQEYFKDTLRFVFTFMDGNVYSFSKPIPISGEGYPSDNEEEDVLPVEFALHQNYPNPFNPSTRIQYVIGSRQYVTLKVYDVLGNEVATLVNEYRDAGTYELVFTAKKLSSGVYYYQLREGDFVETKKMILLR